MDLSLRMLDVWDNPPPLPPPPAAPAARLCAKASARAAFDALQRRIVAHVRGSWAHVARGGVSVNVHMMARWHAQIGGVCRPQQSEPRCRATFMDFFFFIHPCFPTSSFDLHWCVKCLTHGIPASSRTFNFTSILAFWKDEKHELQFIAKRALYPILNPISC